MRIFEKEAIFVLIRNSNKISLLQEMVVLSPKDHQKREEISSAA